MCVWRRRTGAHVKRHAHEWHACVQLLYTIAQSVGLSLRAYIWLLLSMVTRMGDQLLAIVQTTSVSILARHGHSHLLEQATISELLYFVVGI